MPVKQMNAFKKCVFTNHTWFWGLKGDWWTPSGFRCMYVIFWFSGLRFSMHILSEYLICWYIWYFWTKTWSHMSRFELMLKICKLCKRKHRKSPAPSLMSNHDASLFRWNFLLDCRLLLWACAVFLIPGLRFSLNCLATHWFFFPLPLSLHK